MHLRTPASSANERAILYPIYVRGNAPDLRDFLLEFDLLGALYT